MASAATVLRNSKTGFHGMENNKDFTDARDAYVRADGETNEFNT
jgi:hypothetical protein